MVLTLAAREGLLNTLFNQQALSNLLVSGAAGAFFISAHEASPGDAGLQNTNETTYTGYDRVQIVRSYSGTTWAKFDHQIRNARIESNGGPNTDGTTHTITHLGLGTTTHPSAGFLWDIVELITPRVVIPGMTLSWAIQELVFSMR